VKRFRSGLSKGEKKEFPGPMKTMRPENSFPQICVVSVSQFQEIDNMAQKSTEGVGILVTHLMDSWVI